MTMKKDELKQKLEECYWHTDDYTNFDFEEALEVIKQWTLEMVEEEKKKCKPTDYAESIPMANGATLALESLKHSIVESLEK